MAESLFPCSADFCCQGNFLNADSQSCNFNPHGECYFLYIEENESWKEKMSGYDKRTAGTDCVRFTWKHSASCDGCMPGLVEMY